MTNHNITENKANDEIDESDTLIKKEPATENVVQVKQKKSFKKVVAASLKSVSKKILDSGIAILTSYGSMMYFSQATCYI